MAGKRKKPPEGYLSVFDVVKICKRNGLRVKPGSIKWRFDSGKIKGIRDLEDPRKRRLISLEELPGIMGHYEKLNDARVEGRCLCDLARDLGIEEKTLYSIAKRKGIKTSQFGNMKILSDREYIKWKIILRKEMETKKNYLTTGELAKEWNTSHYRIVYWIKTGKVPAKKRDNKYLILKKEFQEYGNEWKKDCGL